MALATYVPAVVFGWLWLDPASSPMAIRIVGLLLALMCALTVVCTAMIYACLRFLQEWATPLTLVNFVLLGCASGLTLGVVPFAVVR